jgi:hypothetical protein
MGYKEVKGPLNHTDSKEKLAGFQPFVLDLTEMPHLLLHNAACYLITGATDITL